MGILENMVFRLGLENMFAAATAAATQDQTYEDDQRNEGGVASTAYKIKLYGRNTRSNILKWIRIKNREAECSSTAYQALQRNCCTIVQQALCIGSHGEMVSDSLQSLKLVGSVINYFFHPIHKTADIWQWQLISVPKVTTEFAQRLNSPFTPLVRLGQLIFLFDILGLLMMLPGLPDGKRASSIFEPSSSFSYLCFGYAFVWFGVVRTPKDRLGNHRKRLPWLPIFFADTIGNNSVDPDDESDDESDVEVM